MKMISLKYFTAIGLALTFVATGCKHKPSGVTPLPDYARTGPKDSGPSGLPDGGKLNPDEIGAHPLPDLGDLEKNYTFDREALAMHTVHFDYDSAAIKSSEKVHVQGAADAFKAMSGVALLIEGHCDERGTEEYNRSLGERRALALREALIALGCDGSKITTKSWGKDHKIDTGNSDAAHARNRRGEFVVLHPK